MAQSSLETDEPAVVLRNTFGEVGLLDMPSAHMAPDGQMNFTVGDIGEQQRYSFSFQRRGWFEGTLRYSHVVGLFSGYDNTHFYDRSFAAKFRLLRESADLPDVSIGLRDILGTGIFSSEYLVASKHFGPLDVTAGMGWGELAERRVAGSPLSLLSARFKTRPPVSYGSGGLPDLNVFFRGPVGFFGGVNWQTPVDGLSVIAEYSSIKYNNYSYAGAITVRSPVNLGLSYRPFDFLAVSAGWFYGTTYGLTVSISGDATKSFPRALRIGPQVPPPAIRTDSQQQRALSILIEHRRDVFSADRGNPWFEAATPRERARQDLLQAYYAEAHGVRDVDVYGTTVVIDANSTNGREVQCASYARIASAAGAPYSGIALADLQDPSGRVTFCGIAAEHNDKLSQPTRELASSDQAPLRQRIDAGLTAQSLQLDALAIGTSEIWVYYENYRYNEESEAIGRIARVLMAEAPPPIEIFHIVAVKVGVPIQEITITRSAMEREMLSGTTPSAATMADVIRLSTPPLDGTMMPRDWVRSYPQFGWSIDPKLAQRLFDPDQPLQLQVYADASAVLQLAPGWLLSTELTGTLWSNYRFTRDANSQLPHVRTDLLEYEKHGKYGIAAMQLIYRGRAAPDVFTEVRAGYFEDMFMGVGGQALWRPEGSRLAFGADVYQVWKRDFNRLFGIQRYNVLTGHLSVYYDTPWNGINVAVHAGRYLAGDYGATLQLTRRFSTGVEIGAWATFTNVPFHTFGEGSFDKGIIIRIPFEWGLPIFSQSAFDLHLASLTRDGGQRLLGDDSLFESTRPASYGEILGHLDDVLDP